MIVLNRAISAQRPARRRCDRETHSWLALYPGDVTTQRKNAEPPSLRPPEMFLSHN